MSFYFNHFLTILNQIIAHVEYLCYGAWHCNYSYMGLALIWKLHTKDFLVNVFNILTATQLASHALSSSSA